MCKISRNAVRAASQRTINHTYSSYPKTSKGSISLSVRYNGGYYHGDVSMSQIRKAYGRALVITEKK